MNQLNPTVWRTCRALGGSTRVSLLRQILECPGQNVSQLAERLEIGISDASQELRRLQSRGLLRRSCQGISVVYLPIPDPQVPSATPLLQALKEAFASEKESDESIIRVAKALGHERRISIVRALLQGPQSRQELSALSNTQLVTLKKHLKWLVDGGIVTRASKKYSLHASPGPLLVAWLKLLRSAS